MTNLTLETLAERMSPDDVLVGARFEALSADDHAAALDRAVKVINRKHARTPQTADSLHIFPAVMSNDSVDSHFSRMDETSLKNYAQDAGVGVPFMNSHRMGRFGGELPLGHTYEGAYEGEGSRKQAKAGIYMMRGLKPNGDAGVATDDMMRAIDSGTVRDGSVGFYGGKSICDICGNDVRDYNACPHIPGTNRKTENGKIATYTVKGARLQEFSGVAAGSTPGAMFSRATLDKTERAIVDNLIGGAQVSYLEEHYRLALSPSRTHYSLPDKADREKTGDDHGNNSRTEETSEMKTKQLLDVVIVRAAGRLPEDVRKSLETARSTMTDDDANYEPVLLALERTIAISAEHADLLAQFRAAGVATVEDARALKADGEDGRSYRKDLIEDALREGVDAQGDAFSKDVYKAVLSEPTRSIAEIKAMRDGWHQQAQARLSRRDENGKPTGTGGRATVPIHGFEQTSSGAKPRASANPLHFQSGRR
jgi:hypothetical protein